VHPELFALLFLVIGLIWLTLMPTSRNGNWCDLDFLMAERVETSIATLGELERTTRVGAGMTDVGLSRPT
jgi:hypothetical protein